MTTVPAKDTIAGWHPANYMSTAREPYGMSYRFREFAGSEPEPVNPPWLDAAYTAAYGPEGGTTDTWDRELLDQLHRIGDEVRAAQTAWRSARWVAEATDALRAAEPTLKEWRRAKAAVDAAYSALDDTPDGQWRAALLRLVDARRAALEVASRLDGHGSYIDSLDDKLPERVLEITPPFYRVAEGLGIELGDWEPTGGADVTYRLTQEIRAQDERIREVYRLAGEQPPL